MNLALLCNTQDYSGLHFKYLTPVPRGAAVGASFGGEGRLSS